MPEPTVAYLVQFLVYVFLQLPSIAIVGKLVVAHQALRHGHVNPNQVCRDVHRPLA